MIKDKLIILSAKGCVPCSVLEKKVGDKIPIYDITEDDDAYNLAQETEITGVPTVLKKDNNKWSKCNISSKDGEIRIECNGQVQLLLN
ncbi:unnamed protein product [marine sediment metagenome]|uniref:Thioredoxin-like fold domain-containing protein n=1 Tax=marine sediment metagenome TaxID=412755 RepID=X1LRM8_9ZZZZ